MAPAYDEVASEFAASENVVIAKIDVDEHGDIAEQQGVEGFPTLKFFPMDDKSGVAYEGQRDAKSMAAYVRDKLRGGGGGSDSASADSSNHEAGTLPSLVSS